MKTTELRNKSVEELTKKLDVKAAKFSETAKKAIEAAGGSAEVL